MQTPRRADRPQRVHARHLVAPGAPPRGALAMVGWLRLTRRRDRGARRGVRARLLDHVFAERLSDEFAPRRCTGDGIQYHGIRRSGLPQYAPIGPAGYGIRYCGIRHVPDEPDLPAPRPGAPESDENEAVEQITTTGARSSSTTSRTRRPPLPEGRSGALGSCASVCQASLQPSAAGGQDTILGVQRSHGQAIHTGDPVPYVRPLLVPDGRAPRRQMESELRQREAQGTTDRVTSSAPHCGLSTIHRGPRRV